MTSKTILDPMNSATIDIEPAVGRASLTHRPRRLRRSEGIRAMVRETIVRPDDLIYPLFAVPDNRPKVEIGAMPGVWQLRAREVVEEAKRAADKGIRAILLFGIPEYKDAIGSSSWDPSGPVQAATEGRHSSQPLASPSSKGMVWVRGASGASGACISS